MTSGNTTSMTVNMTETESLPTADETGFVEPTREIYMMIYSKLSELYGANMS